MYQGLLQKTAATIVVFLASLLPRTMITNANEITYDFATLCSSGIEGTFPGFIDKTPALFNVICLDNTRMAMGINFGAPGTEVPLTLSTSVIDDDGTLVFSVSPMGQADRRTTSSGSPTIYVRLDVEALKKGILNGVFLGGNSVKPELVKAQRKTSLPPLSSLKSIALNPRAVCGTYQLNLPGQPPQVFWFDMVAGVPVVNVFDGSRGLHLIDGPNWDGTGGFAVSDVFGDFTPVSYANLVQMRGYVTKLGEIEIYYVDPVHGVRGPISAIRK